MKVVVLQSNYFPWKGYFDLIHDADFFIFYDTAKYTKNDWRNRNRIYTANGLQWLTIPISADAVKLKINEVTFKDSNWQELHYKTLLYGYKKAPYFRQLDPLLNEILLDQKWTHLSMLNQFIIKKISQLLGLNTEFLYSENFNTDGATVERLVQLLKQANTTEYISGPSAKNYLTGKEHLFLENNILLTFKEYPVYPEYKQLSQPFRHDVSIIDLIANVSFEEIKNYIWDFRG